MTNELLLEEAERLEQKRLAELLTAYYKQSSKKKPRRRAAQQFTYDREPLVIAITRSRAKLSCEVAGCKSPRFLTDENEPFVEVHHLTPLAQGGYDRIDNTVCLCSNHHREIHHGKAREALTEALRRKRSEENA